jgi:hypothetical protein
LASRNPEGADALARHALVALSRRDVGDNPASDLFTTLRKVHRARGDLETVDWLIHIAVPMVCHSILLATGAGFFAGRAEAFVGLAIFSLLLLTLGILSTWELLVWMAVEVNEPRKPGT